MQCCISPRRSNIRPAERRNQRWSHAQHHSRQLGFTLIEVLIGTVLIAILVLGLSGLWTTVNNQFLFLTIKQKAIFVLNGEMERLSALYRFTNFANNNFAFHQVTYNNATDGDDFAEASNPTQAAVSQRLVYSSNSNQQPDNFDKMAVTTDSLFDCPINNEDNPATTQFNADCAGRVLVDENSPSTSDDRNYVWIDQQRRITARLSWRIRDISLNNNFPNADQLCWDNGVGSKCQELTLYLHFPYRYLKAVEPDGDAGFGRRETLVLKTFVGRR